MEIGLLGFGVNIEKKWDVGYFIRGGREKGYVGLGVFLGICLAA
jgi:hypothetical protein